jgi:iron complex outermembrane receptor protein
MMMATFNPNDTSFTPTSPSDLKNIDRLKPTYTQTFEIGYKAVLAQRLRVGLDLYRTKRHDFVGPATVESPNVFLDPGMLGPYLAQEFAVAYSNADPADRATLDQLDNPLLGGNGDGDPIDELTSMYTTGAASIPFGTVTPEEARDPEALLMTYRNFGDVSFYGADISLAFHLNANWNLGGTYSYVSENFFTEDENPAHDLYLNAPRHKFGLFTQYANPSKGLRADTRLRFVDAFDMSSAYVGRTVESYVVVDFNVNWEVIWGTELALTVRNFFDNKHIEFVGAPEMGRLAVLRMTRTF